MEVSRFINPTLEPRCAQAQFQPVQVPKGRCEVIEGRRQVGSEGESGQFVCLLKKGYTFIFHIYIVS